VLALISIARQANVDSAVREIFSNHFNTPSRAGLPDLSGNETFCIFRYSFGNVFLDEVSEFIQTLNSTYDKNFKFIHFTSHSECPDDTTFFVMLGGAVSESFLYDVLEDISGLRPPPAFISTTNLRGFQTTVPGNEFRSFIFAREPLHPVSSNSNPFQSVMLEEILHAVLDADDFESSEIISIFGKNLDVSDYAYWFEKNPKGLCYVDLFLLELELGTGRNSAFSTPNDWYIQSGHMIHNRMSSRKYSLSKYLDPRCS